MIAGSIESHAVFTHCVTIGNDGPVVRTATVFDPTQSTVLFEGR